MALPSGPFRAVWRIPLIYAALGALWTLFSDAAVRLMAQDPATLSRMQTSKGWFFVACTVLLLAALLAREYRVLLAHQRQLEHLNRLYAVLSQVNQSIVREEDRGRLFQEICRIALEFGDFRLAWIGEVAGMEGGLTVLASAVAVAETLGRPGGQGCPAGQAVEQGGIRLIHDLAAAEGFSWRETALALGCRSLASAPDLVRGRTAAGSTRRPRRPCAPPCVRRRCCCGRSTTGSRTTSSWSRACCGSRRTATRARRTAGCLRRARCVCRLWPGSTTCSRAPGT